MDIHEIRKALQEIIEKIDASELKELSVQFALGVLSFHESGMALINKKHL